MITALAQRFWRSRIRPLGILVVACALIVGASATDAAAHTPVPAWTVADQSMVSQPVSVSAEIDTADDAHLLCSSGAAQGCHQGCAGGGACHAMTMAAASDTEPDVHPAAYDRDAPGASSGLDIAPLVHPPNI